MFKATEFQRTTKRQMTENNLSNLPKDLALYSLSFLGPRELKKIRSVNQSFNKLSSHPIVWRDYLKNELASIVEYFKIFLLCKMTVRYMLDFMPDNFTPSPEDMAKMTRNAGKEFKTIEEFKHIMELKLYHYLKCVSIYHLFHINSTPAEVISNLFEKDILEKINKNINSQILNYFNYLTINDFPKMFNRKNDNDVEIHKELKLLGEDFIYRELLDLACMTDSDTLLRFLLNKKPSYKTLIQDLFMKACTYSALEVAKTLLRFGADINVIATVDTFDGYDDDLDDYAIQQNESNSLGMAFFKYNNQLNSKRILLIKFLLENGADASSPIQLYIYDGMKNNMRKDDYCEPTVIETIAAIHARVTNESIYNRYRKEKHKPFVEYIKQVYSLFETHESKCLITPKR